jgi:hypothetical protein
MVPQNIYLRVNRAEWALLLAVGIYHVMSPFPFQAFQGSSHVTWSRAHTHSLDGVEGGSFVPGSEGILRSQLAG